MRQTVVAVTATLVTLIAAIWGTNEFTAKSQQFVGAAPASIAIDVMKMMRDAKGLPEEKFDAH
jgi:hypothetical protein